MGVHSQSCLPCLSAPPPQVRAAAADSMRSRRFLEDECSTLRSRVSIGSLFDGTAYVLLTIGLLAYLLPRTFGTLFYDGDMDHWGPAENGNKGVESKAGYLVLRWYCAALCASAWLLRGMKDGFYDEATSTYWKASPRVTRHFCVAFFLLFLISSLELCRAHSAGGGTMTMNVEGVVTAVTYVALAIIYMICCLSPGILYQSEEEEEYEDTRPPIYALGLRTTYTAYTALSAFGVFWGLLWPESFGVFFYDGDTATGLQHSAAHVLVRMLSALLCTQAWVAYFVARPCRRLDHHRVLTSAFALSGAATAVALIESHQRNDGTMTGTGGLFLLVLHSGFAGAFAFFRNSLSRSSTQRFVQYNRLQNGDEALYSIDSGTIQQPNTEGDQEDHEAGADSSFDDSYTEMEDLQSSEMFQTCNPP